ncbi:hypothetical protein [Actinocorallia populi]|uniref:hypothetical protein n=1 Tax=Actinocorallia populi TaxID=2079200 RepID=UPI001300B386|nr:hypothetical protein [Actinocorallia populi]
MSQKTRAARAGAVIVAAAGVLWPSAALAAESAGGKWKVYGEYHTKKECEDVREDVLRHRFKEARCDSWSSRYVTLWVR